MNVFQWPFKTNYKNIAVALFLSSQNISVSVSVMADDPSNRKKNNAIYASLREAAIKAYQSLVEYGSCMDLSVNKPTSSDEKDDHDSLETDAIFLGEIRRSKLLTVGENLWMTVRSNPDLFNDMISRENDESENAKGSDDLIASYEAKKHQAVAGGYVRAIAARLVFLDHIDTRSSMGCPPSLARHASTMSIKKLGFGLKIFGRAGRAILTHQKEDARGVHDLLSLAVECFNVIKNLSKSNGEAANELEGLMDEAFDTFFMLPNAASLFGEHLSESADTKDRVENWANLVVSHLKQAESFLKDHCNMEPLSDIENGEQNQSISKFATLQRYLPSLARLCYKVRAEDMPFSSSSDFCSLVCRMSH